MQLQCYKNSPISQGNQAFLSNVMSEWHLCRHRGEAANSSKKVLWMYNCASEVSDIVELAAKACQRTRELK